MIKLVFTVVSACIALLVALPLSTWGDVTYSGNRDELEIVKMRVTPAPAPLPSLKYRLTARGIDLVSGNAAPFYYRTFMELAGPMKHIRKENGDEFDNWAMTSGDESIAIANLPLEKVRKVTQGLDGIVRNHASIATSRRDCDWQLGLEDLRGVDVVNFLLPEFQESRQLSRVLAVRTRLAVAEHRYDDAIDVMRMNYRLGVDIANPPFLVCGLIGLAVAGIANDTLIELVAASDSPNMYWALTELPSPLIDLGPAVRYELDFGPRVFPFIHHAETTERAPEEWNRLLKQATGDFQLIMSNVPTSRDSVTSGLYATGLALVGYSHAKERLIAQGMERDRVDKMAVGQVMAIYTERQYLRLANGFERLWHVPFWELRKYERAAMDELKAADMRSGDADREVLPIASQLLPAINSARTAQVRLEREIAAFRVIEALRMYAAEHDGKLPETLEEVTSVPIPLNPATGKPFLYRLEDATGILELPKSDRVTGSNRRFEIQIAAKK